MPKFDVKLKNIDLPELPEVAAKPIYAGVGATDLAVEKVLSYAAGVQGRIDAVNAKVAEVRKDVTTRVTDVQKDLTLGTLRERRSQAEARFADLQSDALTFPTKVQTTVRTKVDENVATATTAYADLAQRGETVVARLRRSETAAPVEVTRKQPAKGTPAAQPADTTTTGKPATKKAPAKKAPAKKAPAKKSTAKKAPAKKAPAKSTSTTTSTAKKTAATDTAAQ